ncbi:RNA polymerase sigma factor [Treponema sp. OMZ 787]|uniref:RNA polymerase sigma factor n=1 Tax=Treponema sp. OMZ 787 TaxID=2563669 RepID=UPI0020A33C58|nr:RNA polymerase sigma factor [Treponema sp. OMZ 787]UTC62611.1 RNA polymerase sigma factor [Treponema sp. OMZ 787]
MENKIDLNLLIDQAGDSLWRFCLRLEKTRLDAEDLYQETMLKAIKLQDKIAFDKNPKAFLFSIAAGIHKNKFRKFFRRVKLAPPSSTALESLSSPYEVLPEIEFEKKELKEEIEKAVSSLPEKIKISVLMFYSADMESNDKTDIVISEILNTGEKTPLHINKKIYAQINMQNNNLLDVPVFIILINIITAIFSGIIFINIGLIFPFFIFKPFFIFLGIGIINITIFLSILLKLKYSTNAVQYGF